MDLIFKEYLKLNLKKEITETEKNTPTISYNSKLTKQIKTHESYVTTFKITSSTTKGKIKNILKPEEKLKISSGKFITRGTILTIEEDEVIVEMIKKIDFGDYKLIRNSNFNNDIILENLEKYIKNGKEVPKEILEGWIDNLKRRISSNYNLKISAKDEIISFLWSSKDKFDIEDPKNLEQVAKNIDKKIKYTKEISPIFSAQPSLEIDYSDEFLNESQKMTICEIFNKKSYKIIGPPGTGKTRTVVEIITQLLKQNLKVLVAGPSNITIDNIIERFLKSKYFIENNPIFYRLGSSLKGLTKFNLEEQILRKTNFIEKDKNEKNFKKIQNNLKKSYTTDLVENTRIVFSTLFSSLKEKTKFDWAIIDEACQSTDVESFLTLIKADHFILVGDPNQLCPKTTSLFQKLDLKTFLLNLQYRMCPNLISFSNEMFYDKKILSHKKQSINLFDQSPMIFIDTDCSDFNETEDLNSKKNEGEALIICKIVKFLQNNIKNFKNDCIGIITPYSAQASLLKNFLDEDVEVKTVDGFQGREKDFIILSLVRSNNFGDFGFLDDFKRLNVAITRSKKGLIVIGDSQNFRKSEIFTKFFKFIEKKFTVIDPLEIDEIFFQ
ncbi:DNA-binding protein SMUBP-2 [Vairimorpha necatrix]|uniref:DNA-binding protein SMUBP-2 n=1 Tax=Vairimorpha necatrix TaxID=6039 RepID=A0AAX4JC58_9MICR